MPDKKPGAAAAENPRKLPKEYDAKFSTLITCYERKEYKRGIKLADEILKRYPNHGETQAMKGLVHNCMNNKEQAYEMVKLGLKNDIRSHVCWHVYGLIYRSDSNYKEASKCYMNALRINPSNSNILRDLSWLHIQLRDYDQFVNNRRRILEGKPGLRTNWVALAMAHYCAGEYDIAFKVVDECNKVHKDDTSVGAYEVSEFLLFQNRCLEKQDLFKEAIDHLNDILPKVVDKLAYHVKMGEMFQMTGQFAAAQEKWLSLLEAQPENYKFHVGLQIAVLELGLDDSKAMFALKHLDLPSSVLQLTPAQKAKLLDIYDRESSLNQKFAMTGIRKIRFSLLEGEALKESLQKHIKACLSKGIPALYQDICVLAKMPTKDGSQQVLCREPRDFKAHPIVISVRGWLDGYISSLKSSSKMDESGPVESPATLLWTMFLQSHMLERSGELEMALTFIDECIMHTPTATDLYMRKARILKKLGELEKASVIADEGRGLDLQDRYLNNKATKYAFRADKIVAGNDLMAMFARNEGDPQMYLASMQCNWYELEAGESHARLRQWGPALKKFYSVQKHFVDYVEDMFDFHGFCVRKTSLRAHADSMAMQDTCASHPFYQRACRGALDILLHLLDVPDDIDGMGNMNPKDRKKERERRKKQKLKDAKAEAERVAAAEEEAKRFGTPSSRDVPQTDDDVDGEKFLARNFLEEAQSWVSRLITEYQNLAPETLAVVMEVFVRASKPLQAMRVISCGLKKYPLHPALTPALVRLYLRLTTKASKSQKALSQNQIVLTIVKEEFQQPWLFGQQTVADFVDALVQQSLTDPSSNVEQLLGAAKCKMMLEDDKEQGQEVVHKLLGTDAFWSTRGVTVKSLDQVVRTVSTVFNMNELAAQLIDRVRAEFPMANFGSFRSDNAASTGEVDFNMMPELEEVA